MLATKLNVSHIYLILLKAKARHKDDGRKAPRSSRNTVCLLYSELNIQEYWVNSYSDFCQCNVVFSVYLLKTVSWVLMVCLRLKPEKDNTVSCCHTSKNIRQHQHWRRSVKDRQKNPCHWRQNIYHSCWREVVVTISNYAQESESLNELYAKTVYFNFPSKMVSLSTRVEVPRLFLQATPPEPYLTLMPARSPSRWSLDVVSEPCSSSGSCTASRTSPSLTSPGTQWCLSPPSWPPRPPTPCSGWTCTTSVSVQTPSSHLVTKKQSK